MKQLLSLCLLLLASCHTVKETTSVKSSSDTTRTNTLTTEHSQHIDSAYLHKLLNLQPIHDTTVVNYDAFCDSLRKGYHPVMVYHQQHADHTSHTTLDSRSGTVICEADHIRQMYDSLLSIYVTDSIKIVDLQKEVVSSRVEYDHKKVVTNVLWKYACLVSLLLNAILFLICFLMSIKNFKIF